MVADPRARKRAILELVIGAFVFGVTAFAAKRATRAVPGEVVAFWRFAIGLAFVFLQSWIRRAPLRPKRWDLLAARGFFGGLAGLFYFLALAEIPVGTATLLNCTSPAFAAVFAWVFLREALAKRRILALCVAMAGVALVVVGEGRILGGEYGWQLVALASGVAAGAAVTTIRAARRTDGPWELFGAFNALGLLMTAPFALRAWVWPNAEGWIWVAAMSVLAVLGQILLTHALGFVEAAPAAVISQLTILTSYALGATLDDQQVTLLAMLGGALAIVGVVWIARTPGRAPPVPAASP
jgi:drug/metabolite transporter (DMT)-like permease